MWLSVPLSIHPKRIFEMPRARGMRGAEGSEWRGVFYFTLRGSCPPAGPVAGSRAWGSPPPGVSGAPSSSSGLHAALSGHKCGVSLPERLRGTHLASAQIIDPDTGSQIKAEVPERAPRSTKSERELCYQYFTLCISARCLQGRSKTNNRYCELFSLRCDSQEEEKIGQGVLY